MVTKRYREPLDRVEVGEEAGRVVPVSFRWRGRSYRVTRVLGHWREDPGWWRRSGGRAIRIEQADLWRVEARNGHPDVAAQGVYELVSRPEGWHLDRVWD